MVAGRRQPGSVGAPVKVIVNAFEIKHFPTGQVQHYDVKIPGFVQRSQINRIMKLLLPRIFGPKADPVAFDGKANLYILSDTVLPPREFKVDENESKGLPISEDVERRKSLTVKISHATTINMFELMEMIQRRTECNPALVQVAGLCDKLTILLPASQAIAALNNVMKMTPVYENGFPFKSSTFYVPSGNKIEEALLKSFSQNPQTLLSGGCEVWGGFFASVRPGIGRMFLNVDRVTGAFVRAGNLLEVLQDWTKLNGIKDIDTEKLQFHDKIQVKRFLKGLIVTISVRDPNEHFKIKDVSKLSANTYVFKGPEDKEMNVRHYLETKFQMRLKHPNLPIVQITKFAWYPLEMCSVVFGRNFFSRLNPLQVGDLMKTRFSTLKPGQKKAAIKSSLDHLRINGPHQKSWEMETNEQPMHIMARQLPAPKLSYSKPGPSGQAIINPQDGGWQLRGAQATTRTRVRKWVIVVFASDGPSRAPSFSGFPMGDVQNACRTFTQGCTQFGVTFDNPEPVIFHAGGEHNVKVKESIIAACGKAGFNINNPPDLILSLTLDGNRVYDEIKRVCDLQLGVASQNLAIRKVREAMRRGQADYWENVAHKVNVKLATGVNQTIATGLAGFKTNPTIVFGADVNHPAPGSFFPSIAGVVACTDLEGVNYAALSDVQPSRQEMIVNLKGLAMQHIKAYYKSTKRKPERILFYRDGVSEGQFEQVAQTDIRALRGELSIVYDLMLRLKDSPAEACLGIDGNYKPKITYVICAKRHHIRILPINDQNRNEADRSGNSKAGTIIDTEFVHPTFDDWYLLSQGGLLGTSRPCHYTVLIDEIGYGTDTIQTMTYQFAYLSPRATRSLSIAAPAHHAHLVCERARNHLNMPSEEGSMTMASNMSDDARRQALYVRIKEKHKQVNEKLLSVRVLSCIHRETVADDTRTQTMFYM